METGGAKYERLQELLADEATQGLDAGERRELEQLLGQFPEVDPDELALAAAALDLLAAPAEVELPDLLRAKVTRDAKEFFAAHETPVVVKPPARSGRGARWAAAVGWLAAAAGWILVVFLNYPQSSPDAGALRTALMDAAADARPIAWSATEDRAAVGATGDVVWSDRRQQGFMRFSGLAANDPAESQYQLWIFDSERDDAHPVDGGVFDIPAGVDEVVVPIRAALPVGEAKMFAVTIERPGGVVVSKRERIAVLAQVEA